VVTRLRVIVAVLIAGLAAAGCAIPTQNVPSAIPPSRVPFDLLSPNLPTTTTTPQSSVPVKIYLVGPNRRLVGESRVAAFPAPLKTVVAILLQGPIQKETRAGIKTAIPNNVQILSATVSKSPDIATVNFNEAFAQIPAADTELAVSQVVFTVVAETSPTTGVVFQIGGLNIPVPLGNGTPVTGPVYLSQYALNGTL
jgi:F0F1-type ATP synthase membrane subunit c/vacuolar-type H+-ATPase subunit K